MLLTKADLILPNVSPDCQWYKDWLGWAMQSQNLSEEPPTSSELAQIANNHLNKITRCATCSPG